MSIETVELRRLSLERAFRIAPKEYIPAYEWILAHAGDRDSKLPSKQNGLEPNLPVKLISQRGIHKPSGFKYALTIRSTEKSGYKDGVITQDDQTWILHYRQQKKADTSEKGTNVYNESLKQCLRDGLPVGVFIASDRGPNLYTCMGLAFVEKYDSESGVFTIHGPVNKEQAVDYWTIIYDEDVEPQDLKLLDEIDEKDERIIKLVEQIQRVRQRKFKQALLDAYDERCAITSCGVREVLQAAHISSYLGPKSQTTSNGLLLRSDLHLLYDSYLITIDPDSHRVRTAPQLKKTPYAELDKQMIRKPSSLSDSPSDKRLSTHYLEFEERNRLINTV